MNSGHCKYFVLYNQLYAEDMSRKKIKVKTNYLRHDPFISFRAFRNLSHCQEQLLQLVITFLIKNVN